MNLHEKCGVFGFRASEKRFTAQRDAAGICYTGLFALQHRGQESAGIMVTDGLHVDIEKGAGLMVDAFRARLPSLNGNCAIGHVRYSTFGGSSFANIQPMMAAIRGGGFIGLAHNGSLTNTDTLRRSLESRGCLFQSTSDSEMMLNMMAVSTATTVDGKILSGLESVEGAYSLVLTVGTGLLPDHGSVSLVGARDPHGFRPLCLGGLSDGSYVLASESCALDAVGAAFIRDVEPGEAVIIDDAGIRSLRLRHRPVKRAFCVFEYIYFARPDSVIDGLNVWQSRHRMGRRLAAEFDELKVQADVVVPVPDTGIAAALGFSTESGIPYAEGLIKNRYVGRTFILPEQAARKSTVEMKLNPLRENLKGKRVVMIDDSIVRGTTSARIVGLLRAAGASEVHMCVSSPPITHPCYYGIDTSIRKELIASYMSENDVRQEIGADTLHYLTLPGLLESVGDPEGQRMCVSCFNGYYPTDVSEVSEPKRSLF
ncbi:MAG: amidophosphoribosyltransferase [Synergistaceae bacterium]|jgi:amidophosphoribosyltransferase|nr:amidophosphoribosyltransferase [Synergistaceae bacterium]